VSENPRTKYGNLASRKDDHIRINRDENVTSGLTTGFDEIHLLHESLPELDINEIDISTFFLGKKIKAPILISSMTGGTEKGDQINERLAVSAESYGIPMGVGSQRINLQGVKKSSKFEIRKFAPSIPIYANLGAVQLNYGLDLEQCQRAIDLIEADALILHLNPLQEALQPEGQTNFNGLLQKIEMVCKKVKIPVIVKEVGWGISEQTAKKLVDVGVTCIDVAGAGGTSWALVEKFRNTEPWRIEMCENFKDWGIPTAKNISLLHKNFPGVPIIASGGIRNGIDAAKSIALGASIAGAARSIFKAAIESQNALNQRIHQWIQELKISMFVTGSRTLQDLSIGKILE